LLRKAIGTRGPAASSDLFELPYFLNALLGRLFGLERFVLPQISLPFGLSLVAVANADSQACCLEEQGSSPGSSETRRIDELTAR
jgi:hypothetical protein